MAKAPKAETESKPVEKILMIIPAPQGLLVTVGTVENEDSEKPPTPIKKLALALALCVDDDGDQYIRAVTEQDIQGEVQL